MQYQGKRMPQLSIRKCFKESCMLTKSNLGAFIGATILLIIVSFFTVGLLFPALVTGLEGMYLKAYRQKITHTKDSMSLN